MVICRKRPIILGAAVIVIAVVMVSLFFYIEASEQPHMAFIPEVVAEKVSGQNYTLSSLTITNGSGLPFGPYGNQLIESML